MAQTELANVDDLDIVCVTIYWALRALEQLLLTGSRYTCLAYPLFDYFSDTVLRTFMDSNQVCTSLPEARHGTS